MIKKLVGKLINKKPERQLSQFLGLGFHGDAYLLRFVDLLLRDCECFIETGTNVGSTLAYVARTYPNVQCVSCEPDKEAFDEAKRHTEKLGNVSLFNMLSQDFIAMLKKDMPGLFGKKTVFWLDAHGYGFKWPLKDELRFITENFSSGCILIDDFKVPGLDCFKYDVYQDQICSFDFVRDSLDKRHGYRVYYPDYTDKTSPHHPLTGWGLIEFGGSELLVPEDLKAKIKAARK